MTIHLVSQTVEVMPFKFDFHNLDGNTQLYGPGALSSMGPDFVAELTSIVENSAANTLESCLLRWLLNQ